MGQSKAHTYHIPGSFLVQISKVMSGAGRRFWGLGAFRVSFFHLYFFLCAGEFNCRMSI